MANATTKLNIVKTQERIVLPERCSVREKGRDCPMPPEFVISVKSDSGEYMVGVACENHKKLYGAKLRALQDDGKQPKRTNHYAELTPVGTACIKSDPDDLIHL